MRNISPVLLLTTALLSCQSSAAPSAEPTGEAGPPNTVPSYRLNVEDAAMLVEIEQTLAQRRADRMERYRSLGEALATTGHVAVSNNPSPSLAVTIDGLLAERGGDRELYRRARSRADEIELIDRAQGERSAVRDFRLANLESLRASRAASLETVEQASLDASIAEVERNLERARLAELEYKSFDPERQLIAPHRAVLFPGGSER